MFSLYWKRHFILKFINKAFIELPLPSNINYYWNLGSLLRFCLIIQLITGILLAMHYCPEIIHSFDSIAHIERNIYSGHMLRNIHANRASIFFLCVYLHIRRNIYHITWSNKITWYYYNLPNYDNNSICGLRITMRTNVILSSYCHNKSIFSYPLHWKFCNDKLIDL